MSPIGLSFSSSRGLDVIWSELLWVCIPAIIIAGAALLGRKLWLLHANPAAEVDRPVATARTTAEDDSHWRKL